MSTELLTPELIAQLGSLELKARRIVDGIHLGQHQGKRIGFSSDFAEHRDYVPGDDVRYVDWKIFAKRDRYYVRRFEDEVKLQAWLLVDASASMTYRSAQVAMSKIEYASTLAASIAWILAQQQDRVGLLIWTDHVWSPLRPASDPTHVRQLFKTLETCQQEPLTDAEQSVIPSACTWDLLAQHLSQISPHSIVFLLTDAFGDDFRIHELLQRLRYQQCDVRVLHLLDPAELSFPFHDHRRFRNLEGGQEIDVTTSSIRDAYIAEVKQWLRTLKQRTIELDCEYTFAETDTPFGNVLRQILR